MSHMELILTVGFSAHHDCAEPLRQEVHEPGRWPRGSPPERHIPESQHLINQGAQHAARTPWETNPHTSSDPWGSQARLPTSPLGLLTL